MSKITVVKQLDEKTIEQRKMRSWPIWKKEISCFPWTYDEEEECLIIDGEIEILTDEGNYILHPGDFVIFSKGLSCTWNIRKPVRKYYNFP